MKPDVKKIAVTVVIVLATIYAVNKIPQVRQIVGGV